MSFGKLVVRLSKLSSKMQYRVRIEKRSQLDERAGI